MPHLPLQRPDGRDVTGGRGCRYRLGQLCSRRQLPDAHIAAINCELVAVGHHEVLDLAVFELEDKVIALDVDDFCVAHLRFKRRLTVLDGGCGWVLRRSRGRNGPERHHGENEYAGGSSAYQT